MEAKKAVVVVVRVSSMDADEAPAAAAAAGGDGSGDGGPAAGWVATGQYVTLHIAAATRKDDGVSFSEGGASDAAAFDAMALATHGSAGGSGGSAAPLRSTGSTRTRTAEPPQLPRAESRPALPPDLRFRFWCSCLVLVILGLGIGGATDDDGGGGERRGGV